jgi:hypothetical protein
MAVVSIRDGLAAGSMEMILVDNALFYLTLYNAILTLSIARSMRI